MKSKQVMLAAGAVVAIGAAAAYSIFLDEAEILGETPAERIAAIREMTVSRPRGAGKVLARVAINDSAPEVRAEAVGALGHFLAPEHRPAVVTCTADSEAHVRAVAAGTLGRFGDAEATDVLVTLAETDPDEQVSHAALRALVACETPRAIVTLLEMSRYGGSKSTKITAMKALLAKFNGRLYEGRDDPDNPAQWRALVQRWKRLGPIRDAYAKAGVPLRERPIDAGHDFHPERRKCPNDCEHDH